MYFIIIILRYYSGICRKHSEHEIRSNPRYTIAWKRLEPAVFPEKNIIIKSASKI